MYTKQTMSVLAQRLGAKIMHMQKARAELFDPSLQANIKSTTHVVESGTVSGNALLRESH